MGQEDVILVLEREGKPLTINELQEIIKLSRMSIYHAIKVLIKYSEVEKSDDRPVKYSIKK